jgi:two-component system NtrC family sensor kinase
MNRFDDFPARASRREPSSPTMPQSKSTGVAPMKSLLVRPIQLLALVFALSLLAALGVLALFTSADFDRVESVRARVNRTRLLQASEIVLKDAQLQLASGAFTGSADRFAVVRQHLSQIPVLGGPVGPVMRERIAQLEQLLALADSQPVVAVPRALSLVGELLNRETAIQTELLEGVRHDMNLERRIAVAALIGFPCLLALVLWSVRQRIVRPIGNLRAFLSRISEGDFTPVSLAGIDPLLLPLFENHNQMVIRLEQLERANRSRTLSLEQEVRAATSTLLKQQQTLARSERLAAAGEVSATLAHELRNPIAGVHVTLSNLRADLGDPGLRERIDLVIAELQRITRLLNGLLQQSSHVPEVRRMVDVGAMVHELATLIRYQLPPQLKLVVEAPQNVQCRLPEDGVRQALLNLVLNAVEASQSTAGEVVLQVEHGERNVCFRVLDDGPGFPDDMLNGGVRPFVTSRESGTGLGLAIVKRFARDLGGELAIANRAPHGACVTMTLLCDE